MRRLAVLLVLLVAGSASAAIVRIRVDDMIHPITDEFIGRALDEAAAQRADAVLIELSTPGGLDESTRSIVQKIIKSPVPVIVYVTPSGSRAASAGFFILEAADVAAMAPGTNTGAAHPVLLGEKLDDVMKMKLQNDAAAFMRSIVEQRGPECRGSGSGRARGEVVQRDGSADAESDRRHRRRRSVAAARSERTDDQAIRR